MDQPNLTIVDAFLENSDALFCEIQDSVEWDQRMKARKTASYGVPYNYSGITYAERAMLPCLLPLCDQLERKLGYRPNNCLLNYYPDGKSTMGYHSDSTKELVEGTGISIVSLGAARSISFRSKAEVDRVISYELPTGSLMHMDAETQDDWKHALPKARDAGPRISMTFRLIRQRR